MGKSRQLHGSGSMAPQDETSLTSGKQPASVGKSAQQTLFKPAPKATSEPIKESFFSVAEQDDKTHTAVLEFNNTKHFRATLIQLEVHKNMGGA